MTGRSYISIWKSRQGQQWYQYEFKPWELIKRIPVHKTMWTQLPTNATCGGKPPPPPPPPITWQEAQGGELRTTQSHLLSWDDLWVHLVAILQLARKSMSLRQSQRWALKNQTQTLNSKHMFLIECTAKVPCWISHSFLQGGRGVGGLPPHNWHLLATESTLFLPEDLWFCSQTYTLHLPDEKKNPHKNKTFAKHLMHSQPFRICQFRGLKR